MSIKELAKSFIWSSIVMVFMFGTLYMTIPSSEVIEERNRAEFENIQKYAPRIQEMSFEDWDALDWDVRLSLIGATK
jgi:hypothetical protein